MPTHKALPFFKILLGLAAVFVFGAFVFSSGKALADTPQQTAVTQGISTLAFKDRFTITGTFNVYGTPQTVNFVDKDPTDNTFNYKPVDSSVFCGGSGITIQNNGLDFTQLGAYSSITANVNLKWKTVNTGGVSCDQQTNPSTVKDVTIDKPDNASIEFTWNSDGSISVMDDMKIPGSSGSWKFTAVTGTPNIFRSDSNKCAKVLVVNGNTSGTVYDLTQSGNGAYPAASGFTDLSFLSGGCYVKSVNLSSDVGNFDSIAQAHFSLAGTPSGNTTTQYCDPQTDSNCTNCSYQGSTLVCTGTTSTNTTGGAVEQCSRSDNGGLGWLFCPVINLLGNAVEKLTNLIEGILRFDVNTFLPDNGGVYQSWSIIRDLASSLLVIILLIMVIAQAVSWGPFDAYTVKKVLPRLVIAVILMQMSWFLSKWIISFSNDAGDGIKGILLAPFPTAGDMKLANLLVHLGGPWAGITNVTLTVALVSPLFIGYLFIPGVAFTALSLLITIVVGFATILFRNILIILLVIASPLALAAWIIPSNGMKRYFKLWSDNFTKILLLFPIMMGLIYAGRIFAWIAGGLGAPGPLDFIMVLVGYFGPYAMLPRTFKWGGSAMAWGAQNIRDGDLTKALRGANRKYVKEDFGKYWQGKLSREMYDPYGKKAGVGIRKFAGVPLPTLTGRLGGRLASKHWMPTAHGRAQTLREGSSWSTERREDAKAYNRRLFELALEHGYAVDEKGNRFLPSGELDKRADGEYMQDKDGNWRKLAVTERQAIDPETGELTTIKRAARWTRGTGAAKQALVDNVALDISGDERVSKDAVEQLIQTSSNPEIENAFVSHGKMMGKRVFEADTDDETLGAWDKEVGGSQTLYPEEAKANYDLQVHLNRNGYGNARDPGPEVVGRTMFDRLSDLGDTTLAREVKARVAEGKRTIMTPAHKSIYNLGYDMGPENFNSQSLGFWQRQLRNANEAQPLYGDAHAREDVGNALVSRMVDLAGLGEAGAAMMRPLVGGEKGKVVDAILALSADPRAVKGWVAGTDAHGAPAWVPVHKGMADFAREAHAGNSQPGVPKPSEQPTADQVQSRYSVGAATEAAPSAEEEAALRTIESSSPGPERPAGTGTTRTTPGTAAAGTTTAAGPIMAPGATVSPTYVSPAGGVGIGPGQGMPVGASEELLARSMARGFRQALRDTPLNIHMPDSGGGERTIQIHVPGLSRQEAQGMDDTGARNWINTHGGLHSIPRQDLMTLYNSIRGAVQEEVRGELERRGEVEPKANRPNLPG